MYKKTASLTNAGDAVAAKAVWGIAKAEDKEKTRSSSKPRPQQRPSCFK
jgi:hypothetical protein